MSRAIGMGLALTLILALSFLLSGMEAGLPLLSRLRIRHLRRQGRASAGVLHAFLERPEEFLWTILVGNTLTNLALLGGALIWLEARFPQHRAVAFVCLAALAFLLYAVADLLPKMLFRRFPTRLCLALARPFQLIHLVLRPVVAPVAWLANTLLWATGGQRFTGRLFGSREEFRSLLQDSAQALSGDERAMVNRVLDVQSQTVGSLMIPLAKATTIAAEVPLSEFFRICRETGRQRLPVLRRGAEAVAGVISLRSTLYRADIDRQRTVAEYMREPLYLEASLRLEEALKRFQRSGHRLGIVLDRDRREVGLIGLGDVLRYFFGELAI
jgi:CBS domain containing-hemolysin-like protein